MTSNGQTHSKRAREFALKERRALKQAKKDARAAGNVPAAGDDKAPEAPPETTTEWVR